MINTAIKITYANSAWTKLFSNAAAELNAVFAHEDHEDGTYTSLIEMWNRTDLTKIIPHPIEQIIGRIANQEQLIRITITTF